MAPVWQTVGPEATRVQAQSGSRVLAVYGDVSGSTVESDPGEILNSLIPAAAYASAAGRTFVATFADEVSSPEEVLAADEQGLGALENRLVATPRGGATATAEAVGACLDLLEDVDAAPGSACLLATDGRPEPDSSTQLRLIEDELAPRAEAAGYQLLFLGFLMNDPEGERVFDRVTQITGAPPYRTATKPEDLAEALLSLIASWRGANIESREIDVPTGGQASTHIVVDPREPRLDILAVRADASTEVLLRGPHGGYEVPRLKLEGLQAYSLERPAPGEYLLIAGGVGPAHVSVLALHDGGLSAEVVGDPAVLPLGEEGAVLLALTDHGARYPATDARAAVNLTHTSGRRFTADAVLAEGGAFLSARFPPLPAGGYQVEVERDFKERPAANDFWPGRSRAFSPTLGGSLRLPDRGKRQQGDRAPDRRR